jgi:LysR family glycine cleavage system transcriptional activator
LDVIEAATRAVARPTTTDLLIVQVAPSLASSWLVPKLADFIHRHPAIQIRLLTNGASDLDERAHCEIRYGHGRWPLVDARLLWKERLCLLASPELAASIRSPESLTAAILLHTRSRLRGWRELFAQYALPAHRGQEMHLDRTNLALEAARAGLGIALESPLLARPLINERHLVQVLPELILEDEAYYFVAARDGGPEPALRFRDWLHENLPLPAFKASP